MKRGQSVQEVSVEAEHKQFYDAIRVKEFEIGCSAVNISY